MKRHHWTEAEVAMLRSSYATCNTAAIAAALGVTPHQVLCKAGHLGLSKSRELIAEEARANSLRADHGGRKSQFKPGQVPLNKGVKGWQAGGRSVHTQFKPGMQTHTWVPVGSYTVNPDGQLMQKVGDVGPQRERWQPVTRLVWVEANGPVPEGMLVRFKPGRHSVRAEDITLDALELVSRAEHMKGNSIHRLPPEFAELARLKGQLARAINRKAKEAATS